MIRYVICITSLLLMLTIDNFILLLNIAECNFIFFTHIVKVVLGHKILTHRYVHLL